MNIPLEINAIKKELDAISVENLITTIKSILKFARSKNTKIELHPFTIEEYVARAQQAEMDIKLGLVKDIETLELVLKMNI